MKVAAAGLVVLIFGGFLLASGPLSRLFSMEGDSFSRYAAGGWYVGCDPAVSPASDTIVYSSPRSGHGDIYCVNLDGTGTRRLTSDPMYEAEPAYAPDGELIAYVKQVRDVGSSYKAEIFVMNSDGTNTRQLTRPVYEYEHPAFQLDGKSVLCTRILNHKALGTVSIALADGSVLDAKAAPGWAAVVEPKRRSLLYVDAPPSNSGADADHFIWRKTPGRVVKPLVPGSSPALSPDGRLIAFVGEPYGQTLWLMNSDGSGRRKIFSRGGHSLERPSFARKGKSIVVHEATDRGVGDLIEVVIQSGRVRTITSTR